MSSAPRRQGIADLAHAAGGETVLPNAAMRRDPMLRQMAMRSLAGQGRDPSRFTMGGRNSRNPGTGRPEFADYIPGVGWVDNPVTDTSSPFDTHSNPGAETQPSFDPATGMVTFGGGRFAGINYEGAGPQRVTQHVSQFNPGAAEQLFNAWDQPAPPGARETASQPAYDPVSGNVTFGGGRFAGVPYAGAGPQPVTKNLADMGAGGQQLLDAWNVAAPSGALDTGMAMSAPPSAKGLFPAGMPAPGTMGANSGSVDFSNPTPVLPTPTLDQWSAIDTYDEWRASRNPAGKGFQDMPYGASVGAGASASLTSPFQNPQGVMGAQMPAVQQMPWSTPGTSGLGMARDSGSETPSILNSGYAPAGGPYGASQGWMNPFGQQGGGIQSQQGLGAFAGGQQNKQTPNYQQAFRY